MSDYSLWLTAERKTQDFLRGLIRGHGERFKTEAFEPHVTLFPSVPGEPAEIFKKVGKLTQALSFYVSSGKVSYTDEFFKCLFVEIARNVELDDLRYKAARMFDLEPEPYLPHISLLYGNFPETEKIQLAHSLPQGRIPALIGISAIEVWETDTPDKLAISSWRPMKRFTFK